MGTYSDFSKKSAYFCVLSTQNEVFGLEGDICELNYRSMSLNSSPYSLFSRHTILTATLILLLATSGLYIYFQQSSSSDLQHIGCVYLEAGPGFQTQEETKLIIALLSSDPSFVIFLSTSIRTNLRITKPETWKSGELLSCLLIFLLLALPTSATSQFNCIPLFYGLPRWRLW